MLTKKHDKYAHASCFCAVDIFDPFGVTDWTLPICWILFGCHVKLHSWKFESGLTDIRAVVFFTFWFSHGLTSLAFFRNLLTCP